MPVGKFSTALFDLLGTATSFLCLVHCLALPLAALLLPALSFQLPHNDLTHTCLAAWVIVFCLLSVIPGYKNRHPRVIGLMMVGVSFVLVATFATTIGFSEAIELPLITAGNLLVILAHHFNRKLRCSCTLDRELVMMETLPTDGPS